MENKRTEVVKKAYSLAVILSLSYLFVLFIVRFLVLGFDINAIRVELTMSIFLVLSLVVFYSQIGGNKPIIYGLSVFFLGYAIGLFYFFRDLYLGTFYDHSLLMLSSIYLTTLVIYLRKNDEFIFDEPYSNQLMVRRLIYMAVIGVFVHIISFLCYYAHYNLSGANVTFINFIKSTQNGPLIKYTIALLVYFTLYGMLYVLYESFSKKDRSEKELCYIERGVFYFYVVGFVISLISLILGGIASYLIGAKQVNYQMINDIYYLRNLIQINSIPQSFIALLMTLSVVKMMKDIKVRESYQTLVISYAIIGVIVFLSNHLIDVYKEIRFTEGLPTVELLMRFSNFQRIVSGWLQTGSHFFLILLLGILSRHHRYMEKQIIVYAILLLGSLLFTRILNFVFSNHFQLSQWGNVVFHGYLIVVAGVALGILYNFMHIKVYNESSYIKEESEGLV